MDLNKIEAEAALAKQLNVKSTVARVLARENINIVRGNFRTAYFDVQTRTLGLPLYKDSTDAMIDLMIGHEVGHALYTPLDGLTEVIKSSPRKKDLVNIVEDIRIETMIRSEYPGLISIFRKGYEEFVDRGLFGKIDVPNMKFIDRLNLHAKTGIDPNFTDEEATLYKKCLAAKTFDDVLEVVDELEKFIKSSKKDMTSNQSNGHKATTPEPEDNSEEEDVEAPNVSDDLDSESEDEAVDPSTEDDGDEEDEAEPLSESSDDSADDAADDTVETDGTESDEDDDVDTDDEDGDEDDVAGYHDDGEEHEDPEDYVSDTVQSMDEGLADTVDTANKINHVLEPLESTIDKHIVEFETTQCLRDKRLGEISSVSIMKSRYTEWLKENRKVVALLKKEFDMKKAAFQYSRATQSRRGTLDLEKLHTYKFDDNIFQSVTTLANAKDHGMVFVIDMSISMTNVIGDTYRRALLLAMFCKAVGIPFKIYGFTSSFAKTYEEPKCAFNRISLSSLHMVELLTSDLKTREFKHALESMFITSYYLGGYNERFSDAEFMGYTPTNQMLIALHTILNRFRKQHPVQRMNTVVLTDGDSSPLSDTEGRREMHVKLNGNLLHLTYNTTHTLLQENLKKTCNTNYISIGLVSPNSFRGRVTSLNVQVPTHATRVEAVKGLNKDGIFKSPKMFGEDLYLLIKGQTYNSGITTSFADKDLNGKSDAAITRELLKSINDKKGNRIFATEFVKIIG